MPGPSPSLASRQVGMHGQPGNDGNMVLDLNRVHPELLALAKQEVGLQDRPINALTHEEKVGAFTRMHTGWFVYLVLTCA